jgi:phosphoserine phosphatase
VYPIIDSVQKRSLLLFLSSQHKIPISQTMAIGDGANDLLMLNAAGLGVAWRAKSKVQLEAPSRLNGESLADLLFLLGVSAGEGRELLK